MKIIFKKKGTISRQVTIASKSAKFKGFKGFRGGGICKNVTEDEKRTMIFHYGILQLGGFDLTPVIWN